MSPFSMLLLLDTDRLIIESETERKNRSLAYQTARKQHMTIQFMPSENKRKWQIQRINKCRIPQTTGVLEYSIVMTHGPIPILLTYPKHCFIQVVC